MWHASVAVLTNVGPKPIGRWSEVESKKAKRIIRMVLKGVGLASHEWREMGECAMHHRRRATADEAAFVGGVVDVRGRDEVNTPRKAGV